MEDQTGLHTFVCEPTSIPHKDTIVVFSHGFHANGVESSRNFLNLSQNLLELGYTTILFDYRGSGYSDLLYEEITFDTLLADLNAIVDFARSKYPEYRIILWGVSLGSALAASLAAKKQVISLLVLWCLSADLYSRYRNRFGQKIEANGYVYTDKGYKVSSEFLDSLRDRNIYLAIKSASIPTLLVHGTADVTASVELSRTAHKLAPDNTTLHEIEDGNHGFVNQSIQYDKAVDITLDWITKHAT